VSDSDEIEREVAFAALGGWEKTFEEALERYCQHCRSLPLMALERRPHVLLDFNLWVDPVGAASGIPLGPPSPRLTTAAAARYLATLMERGSADPYAILGALARECEK
jgi:hypothetical protein